MPRVLLRPVLGLTALAVLVTGCIGTEHPDLQRYEYLYIRGSFQQPYTRFPEGNERLGWKCYDQAFGRALDCTFVHRGWQQYDFIYRRRR